MLVKIGTFTAVYDPGGYNVDLGTEDYDTIIIISMSQDVKAGLGISSALNNRSAYGSDYADTLAPGNGNCLHGSNAFFKLLDGGKTLRLTSLNIAWSSFTSYYILLKLNPLIPEEK